MCYSGNPCGRGIISYLRRGSQDLEVARYPYINILCCFGSSSLTKVTPMSPIRQVLGVIGLASALAIGVGPGAEAQPPRTSPPSESPAEEDEDASGPRTRFDGDMNIEGVPAEGDLLDEELPPPPPPPPPDGLLPLGEVARLSFTPRDRPKAVFQGDWLVVVTDEGVVAGHDAATGEFVWKQGLPGERLMRPVALHGDDEHPSASEVLISATNGHLLVLDAASGEIRREVHLEFEIALPPMLGPQSLVLMAMPNGAVVAHDLQTGTDRFKVQTGEPPLAMSVGAGMIAVSGADHTLTAVNISDGSIRWTFRGRGAFFAPAAFDATGSRLYIGDDRGDFYCIETEKGTRKFRWPTGASIRYAALVEDDSVFITSYGNNLYAYRAGNGHELWRTNIPGRPATGPLRLNGRLLVATFDGVLLEVHPLTGRLDARYSAPAEIQTAPSFLLAERPEDAPLTPEEVAALKADGKEVPLQFWQVDESQPATSAKFTAAAEDADASEPGPASEVSSLPESGEVPVAEGRTAGGEAMLSGADRAPTEPMWYELSRIALPLRTGELLLLKHQRPVAPAAPATEGLEPPPGVDGGGLVPGSPPSVPPKPPKS